MGGIAHEPWRLNGSRIHADLIGACVQKALHVVGGANTATNGKWDKNLVGHGLNHGKNKVTVVGRGCDVEKGEFVRTIKVISTGNLHRVPGIAKLNKVGALHDAPCIHIKAGNNALG